MLSKALISLLISLNILKPSAYSNLFPGEKLPSTSNQQQDKAIVDKVSLPDEVYADIALQHEIDHMSVYYFDDNPNNTISIKADKNWVPASTVKLFAAMYAFDQVARGKISLDQSISIDSKNVAASQNDPNGYPPLEAGENVSVYRLIDQMITQSDNTAFNTLLDLLDRQEINKYIHDLGLTASSIGSKLNLDDSQQSLEYSVPGFGDNLITAADYAKAFIMIKGGRIPGSDSLYSILSRQKLNSMIPAYLPKNVVVAHKTGELDPFYHDGGIISDSNRKYVLSVFSNLGDPNIVAHLSYLVYSEDLNLVGNNGNNKAQSEVPNAPIDPLVTQGTLEGVPGVLAASTENIKLPSITATDLGIKASDLSTALDPKQLPQVIIPTESPLHLLVDLGHAMSVALNPIPSLRVNQETDYQKLKLAEANLLLSKGKKDQADVILGEVSSDLSNIAQESSVKNNIGLQTAIDQVSETRFSILKEELNSSDSKSKVEVIKQIAKDAVDTTDNVKPFVQDAVKTKDLSQSPLVGQVVRSTQTSITIKTDDGKEVTTQVDPEIKTRDANDTDTKVQRISDIPVGSTIALAGFSPDATKKASFVLTNIATDSANPAPVTVVKVNEDTNTLVVASNGVPVQIDLTPDTIIKGIDTTVSLNEIKPGDVIVIHGQPIPIATPSGAVNASPSASPEDNSQDQGGGQSSGSTDQGGSNNNSGSANALASSNPFLSPTPLSTLLPLATLKPTAQPSQTSTPMPAIKVTATQSPSQAKNATPAPAKVTATAAPKPAATPVPAKPAAPQVIKGNVIQVVQQAPVVTPAPSKPTSTAVPSTPAPTAKPK